MLTLSVCAFIVPKSLSFQSFLTLTHHCYSCLSNTRNLYLSAGMDIQHDTPRRREIARSTTNLIVSARVAATRSAHGILSTITTTAPATISASSCQAVAC